MEGFLGLEDFLRLGEGLSPGLGRTSQAGGGLSGVRGGLSQAGGGLSRGWRE